MKILGSRQQNRVALVIRVKGGALLIVLMLAAVMSAFMLSLLGGSRVALDNATAIGSHLNGRLDFETARSKLLMEMYTTPLHILGPKGYAQVGNQRQTKINNFHGAEFQFEDVVVQIQDTSGLVTIQPFDEEEFERLLAFYEVQEDQRVVLTEQILDWIDEDTFVRMQGAESGDYAERFLPANRSLQNIEELSLLPNMTEELFDNIRQDLALYGNANLLEPFTPDKLLPLIFNETEVQFIENKRNYAAEPSASGGGGELIYPSGHFNVRISGVEYGKNSLNFSIIRGLGTLKPFYVVNEKFN